MKRSPHGWVAALVGLCSLWGMAQESAQPEVPFRTWTSYNGQTVKARFVELGGDGVVVLRREDGVNVRLRAGLLAQADQDLARTLEAKRKAGPAAESVGASAKVLPVYKEGPAKGLYAAFSNATYTASIHPNGTVSIQCLDAHGKAGKPIRLAAQYGYNDPQKKRYVGRKVVSFDPVPPPSLTPASVVLEGTLDDGVRFGQGVAFKPDSVVAWGWVEDPKGLSTPTAYQYRFQFAASHEFGPQVTVPEIKKALEGCVVSIRPIDGKSVRHAYGDSIQRLTAPALLAEVEGPVFGARRVSVSAAAPKEASLLPYIYSGFAPYQGFSIGLQKVDKASRSEKCQMVLKIE